MSDFYNKYPYTDFHELNLDWIIERVKQLTADWLETKQAWENTEADWQELYNYVHDYFDNLDVQEEINNKINAMIADGTFVTITTPVIEAKVASMMPGTVASQIGDTVASQIGATVASQIGATVASQIDDAVVSPVNAWLTDHITQPTTPVVDTSLSISGAAADAAVTGAKINKLNVFDDCQTAGNSYYNKCIIKKDITTISSTPSADVVDFNTMNTFNVGKHIEMSISSYAGKMILVSGRTQTVGGGVNYGLYCFTDVSDNVILTFGSSITGYNDVMVCVPSNASKIIVNGNDSNLPTVKSFTQIPNAVVSDEVQEIKNELIEKYAGEYNKFSVTTAILDNVVNFYDMSTFATGNHIEFDVTDYQGKRMIISGRTQAVTLPAYNYDLFAFIDADNNIISTFGGTTNQVYNDITVIIPDNAVMIIINGSTDHPASLYAADYSPTLYLLDNRGSQEEVGLRNFKNDSFFGSTDGLKVDVEGAAFCVIEGRTSSINSSVNYTLYGFYDASDNLLAIYENAKSTTAYHNIRAVVPDGAKWCYINGYSTTPAKCNVYKAAGITDILANNAEWKNKKIGILGTSVAIGANASAAYITEASKKLGFDIGMYARAGMAIITNNDGSPLQYGSLTCTLAEYAAAGWTIASDPDTSFTPGVNPNSYYASYEHIFTMDNADVDLWIYAVIPNNSHFTLEDWDAFDKTNWKYTDDSPFSDHRTTFIGALLFLMDQMYQINPKARMVFLVDSSFSYSQGLSNLQTLATEWNIPIINLWSKINTSPKSLAVIKSVNGTNNHPSTYAHQLMGSILTGELSLVK